MPGPIYTAPPRTGTAILGKTLPDLLYTACDRYENPRAFNQAAAGEGFTPTSLHAFRAQSEEIALGLRALGLGPGDKVALFMESDVHFCRADMGCLLAGVVDVPVYLSHAPEHIEYVIDHAEARAVIVTDRERLEQLAPVLAETPRIERVVVAEPIADDEPLPTLPQGVELLTLAEVRRRGRLHASGGGDGVATDLTDAVADLRAQIHHDDLATLIYTSGTTGKPKGVMLSHENISFNAMSAFSGIPDFVPGADGEVALSFLPMTHIFARALQYGYMGHGMSVYFVAPDRVVGAMPAVRPTVFASVPRVLEKVHTGIRKKIMEMEGMQKSVGMWALDIAESYDLDVPETTVGAVQRRVADRLVYAKWREALGGRIKYIIVGGAALSGELTNVFAAAGITALQGYGLTETSPVITYNRPSRNHPGTTGEPMAGVEVRLGDDGEILTRGPHVMRGYYKNEEKTREVIDEDGWFRTGDIGTFTDTGLLKITDRKKDLFKLSTGKYVMPQPIENKLADVPFIDRAVVVGAGHKYCAALIFPSEDALRAEARDLGLDAEMRLEHLVKDPEVLKLFERAVEEANAGMDHWSTVKRFVVVPDELTVESELLTPTMKVKRRKISDAFAGDIEALYREDEDDLPKRAAAVE